MQRVEAIVEGVIFFQFFSIFILNIIIMALTNEEIKAIIKKMIEEHEKNITNVIWKYSDNQRRDDKNLQPY